MHEAGCEGLVSIIKMAEQLSFQIFKYSLLSRSICPRNKSLTESVATGGVNALL